MITTEFLHPSRYAEYAVWLKAQDAETRQLYFGISIADEGIDSLVKKIQAEPGKHYFLVATELNQWVGTIHLAINSDEVEFGIMVKQQNRRQGIADAMMSEALVWCRNRGYTRLFMHCMEHNRPIRHLCVKHGLQTRNMYGDIEAQLHLDPATWCSVADEIQINCRKIWYTWLKNNRLFLLCSG